MNWLKIGLFVIRHWSSISPLLMGLKTVAEDFKKETGISMPDAVATTAKETAKSLPVDEIARQAQIDRGLTTTP